MATRRSPLRGYNHNIRYRNRIYHVQTEDSGLDKAHVFTHVYFGGIILGSSKLDYSDVASETGHEKVVQKRMQHQHKELMKQLKHGDFDERILQLLGDLEGDPAELENKGKGATAAAQTGSPGAAPEAPAPAAAPAPVQAAVPGVPRDVPPGKRGSLEDIAAVAGELDESLAATAPEAGSLSELALSDDARVLAFGGGLAEQSGMLDTAPEALLDGVTSEHEGDDGYDEQRLTAPLDVSALPAMPIEEVNVVAAATTRHDEDRTLVSVAPEMHQGGTPSAATPAVYAASPSVDPAADLTSDRNLRMGTSHRHRRIQIETVSELPDVVVETRRDPSAADYPIVSRPPTGHGRASQGRPETGDAETRRPAPDVRSSGVFEKPLPQNAQVPAAAEMFSGGRSPVLDATRTQSLETRGLVNKEARVRDPRQGQPTKTPHAAPPQGSTPQRYTAPSAKKRRRLDTGSYATVGQQGAPPRAPSRHPESEQVPSGRPAAVVARPAVVVGREARVTLTQVSKNAVPGQTGPTTAKARARSMTGETRSPRRGARNTRSLTLPSPLPNVFGSEVVSERSLDEVILHYLAEDGEKKE